MKGSMAMMVIEAPNTSTLTLLTPLSDSIEIMTMPAAVRTAKKKWRLV